MLEKLREVNSELAELLEKQLRRGFITQEEFDRRIEDELATPKLTKCEKCGQLYDPTTQMGKCYMCP